MNRDASEALCNALIGIAVSWLATYNLFPFFGLHPSATQSVGVTAMMFWLSFGRAWIIRAIFRGTE